MNLLYLFLILSTTVLYCDTNDVISFVKTYISNGDFTQAEKYIDLYISASSQTLSIEDKTKLLFEKERLQRIRLDYKKTKYDILKELHKKVLNFNEEEFYIWDQMNLLDKINIDNKIYYFNSAVSNLFFRNREIYKRAINWKNLEDNIRKNLAYAKSVEQDFEKTRSSLLQGTTFVITFTIIIPENIIEENKIVRCWLPFPIEFDRQQNVELLSSTPVPKYIIYKNTDIGYLYFEQPITKNSPTMFQAKFKFISFAYYNKIELNKVLPYNDNDSMYLKHIIPHTHHEEPFPELEKLTKQIVKNEQNPYIKSKLIYDWITDNFLYSYAPEYSTIENLTKYTFEHKYGDCGQQGMLFITMCKIAGVPARWQSGWYINPEDYDMHDWAEIYIQPYGWIPVDVYWGSFVKHYSDLNEKDKDFLANFYFGNIDKYRFVINNNHSLSLTPAKNSFRSEYIDFQRGELECETENLYFDKFKVNIKIEQL